MSSACDAGKAPAPRKSLDCLYFEDLTEMGGSEQFVELGFGCGIGHWIASFPLSPGVGRRGHLRVWLRVDCLTNHRRSPWSSRIVRRSPRPADRRTVPTISPVHMFPRPVYEAVDVRAVRFACFAAASGIDVARGARRTWVSAISDGWGCPGAVAFRPGCAVVVVLVHRIRYFCATEKGGLTELYASGPPTPGCATGGDSRRGRKSSRSRRVSSIRPS